MLLDEKREKENARIRKGGHKAQKECRDRNKGTVRPISLLCLASDLVFR